MNKRKSADLRILVVDADPDVRDAVADTLKEFSREIVRANSGREALDQIYSNPQFDLIISGYHMAPGITGGELNRELHKKGYQIPFILMSGDPLLIPNIDFKTSELYALLDKVDGLSHLPGYAKDIQRENASRGSIWHESR